MYTLFPFFFPVHMQRTRERNTQAWRWCQASLNKVGACVCVCVCQAFPDKVGPLGRVFNLLFDFVMTLFCKR